MTANEDWISLENSNSSGLFRPRDLALSSGAGSRVTCADGRSYLDFTAGYGTASLGHCHPKWVQAIQEQAARLAASPTIFGNPQRSEYQAALLQAVKADGCGSYERVFLCNSGTEANEAALKFARLTHPGRRRILACMRGFHGRSLGALSVTWDRKYRDAFGPFANEVTFLPYGNIDKMKAALDDQVFAIILEPVQGEGGIYPAERSYLEQVIALGREHGALSIFDEVQTGVGRTGRFLAGSRDGCEADLVCLAKGLAGGFPMGAVLIGNRVTELKPGQHGSTFGGNPLACAAANAVLRVIADEDILANVRERSEEFRLGLTALESSCEAINAIRLAGLMIGIELKDRALSQLQDLQEAGLLALPAGPRVIRFLPPLTVSAAEIQEAIKLVAQVLGASAQVEERQ